MTRNLKPRKCRVCRAEYKPKTEWQKYCSDRCKAQVANRKKSKLVRMALKLMARLEAEKGAA